jgi:hypothetical protein
LVDEIIERRDVHFGVVDVAKPCSVQFGADVSIKALVGGRIHVCPVVSELTSTPVPSPAAPCPTAGLGGPRLPPLRGADWKGGASGTGEQRATRPVACHDGSPAMGTNFSLVNVAGPRVRWLVPSINTGCTQICPSERSRAGSRTNRRGDSCVKSSIGAKPGLHAWLASARAAGPQSAGFQGAKPGPACVGPPSCGCGTKPAPRYSLKLGKRERLWWESTNGKIAISHINCYHLPGGSTRDLPNDNA